MATGLGIVRPSERVSVRFGASLLSNAARLTLSFASGLLVARGLGASTYGDYQFLLASAASLTQFLDLGTSQAFFTFISRDRRRGRFFVVYGAWLALQFLLVVGVVTLIAPSRTIAIVWLGHSRTAILLAFVATFLMNELWEAVAQLGEAQRRTIVVQGAAMCQAAAHLTLIGIAVFTGRLSVTSVFIFITIEYGTLIAILGQRFLTENTTSAADVSFDTVAGVVGEFYAYCRPLLVYAMFGFAFMFADRWMLQRFGGSQQQGFFGVGQQFSIISLVATNSILQVFWKEIAAATSTGNLDRAWLLYFSTSRAIFFVAAWTSFLFIPYSGEILTATLGADYRAAAPAFAVMLLYPIQQSMGRIGGSFLQAAGHTDLYARVGLVGMSLSLPLAYLLLAPRSALVPGLALGALGLTLKLVILNGFSVNLQAYVIARRSRKPYDWRHQIATIASLLALGFGCRLMAERIMGGAAGGPPLVVPVVGSALYVAATALVVFRLPAVVGLTREQAASIISAFRQIRGST